ncbi:MAG: sigma-24, subfamily [Acidobacteriaceae bacterium]|nr:sigma-24, subfamily [Acidobacteriaceae bacterium]
MPIDTNPIASAPPANALLQELYALSKGKDYGLTEAQFSAILAGIGSTPKSSTELMGQVDFDFYRSLRLEELALARGCSLGDDGAWEVFLTRYREKLYDSARYITREDSSARELADSIYADLFVTSTRDGQRVSKLSSYTGRGSLEGWLRTVLAQEWVNRYRKRKREVSLEEESEAGAQFAAPAPSDDKQVRPPVVIATDAALAALSSQDRFILASYYLDKRTLAEIARTLRVHESTISRKVEKLGKSVRKKILDHLVKSGMSRRQAEEAMEFDVRDWPDVADMRVQLAREAPSQGLPAPKLAVAAAQESPKEAFQVMEGQVVEGKKDQDNI